MPDDLPDYWPLIVGALAILVVCTAARSVLEFGERVTLHLVRWHQRRHKRKPR
jgi:hypothetical protein